MLEHLIQRFLSDRSIEIGQSIQLGWFYFWITEVGPPIRFRSLDFKRMATFTTDLSAAKTIYLSQQKTLLENFVDEEPCTFRNTALVSKSYTPGHQQAFLKRDQATHQNDSGWYVGILNDPLSMEDQSTFEIKSLYELSIHDDRMFPYWLMPVGTLVHL